MEEMQNWFMGLDPVMQIFWGCALIASFVFVIQTVLTLLGMEHDMDFDVPDTDADTMSMGGSMSLFSVRSVVNFFVGFGWAGISLNKAIGSTAVLIIVSLLIGLLFSYATIVVVKKMLKLEQNGAVKIDDCLGKEADVYLKIPAEGKGRGKVQVSIDGSVHELDAITDGEEIKTGARIKIVEVTGALLKVKPLTTLEAKGF